MEKRNQYLDFVKGILIFLMLLGHMIQYGSGEAYLVEEFYWENWAFKAIYSFHMPLFIAISGYLTYFSFQKGSPFTALQKRSKKLFPPIVSWVPIVMLLAFAVNGQPFTIRGLARTFLSGFWFLWAVLLCTAGMAVAESLPKRFRSMFYVIAAILILFIPDIVFISYHKFMFPYFVAGYYFAKSGKNIGDRLLLKAGIASGIWIILLLFFNKDTYIYTTGISILPGYSTYPFLQQLGIVVYRYLIGFVGCVAVSLLLFAVWRKINKCASGVILTEVLWLGKHSLAIYILSTYLYVYLVPAITKNAFPNIVISLLATVLMAAVCAGLAVVISKCKFLSKVLIGE